MISRESCSYPLIDVWQDELVPLLEANPELLPVTLLEYLDDKYPGRFSHCIHRTLQRRVKAWRAQYGPGEGSHVPSDQTAWAVRVV